jgi:hypothetical protein
MYGTLFQSCICRSFLEEQSKFSVSHFWDLCFRIFFQVADHSNEFVYSHIYV